MGMNGLFTANLEFSTIDMSLCVSMTSHFWETGSHGPRVKLKDRTKLRIDA